MNTVLAVVVMAAFALLAGAFVLWRKGATSKQVTLMILLAAVMIANVLIWTVPDSSGVAPVEKAEALAE